MKISTHHRIHRLLNVALGVLVLLGCLDSLKAAMLVPFSSPNWRLKKGLAEASTPIEAWRSPTYDDSSWAMAPAPFWYGDTRTGGTQLTDMINSYSCVFLRTKFVVDNPTNINAIQLSYFIDDGYVMWINGVEVSRFQVSDPLTISTLAGNQASDPAPTVQTTLPTPVTNYLVAGTNVLCVQVFNTTLNSSDLGFDCQLISLAPDLVAPSIASQSPPAGVVLSHTNNLTRITVDFSEAVVGVDASDLLVNGVPATGLSGSAATYTFTFPQPEFGTVSITWAPGHGIADYGIPPNAFDGAAPGNTWQYTFVDSEPPVVVSTIPATNTTVRSLTQVEVLFSEGVTNVDASDLLVNGTAATNLILLGPDQYLFRFAQPATGAVTVAWAPNHGITDRAQPPNPFAGGELSYTLDPQASFADVRINEIVASNRRGLADEDGDREDWIEIFNAGNTAVDLNGWHLTDDAFNLTKWVFPAVSVSAGGYLVVWASEKNRRVPGAPLHTNFKLEKSGEYLALVLPDGSNVVSSFSPVYPEQFDDISYGRDRIDPQILAYFSTNTPGAMNSANAAGLGVGPEVQFSRKSGTFRNAFTLELAVPEPGFVIRYFLVTNAATAAAVDVPSATNALYTGPIPISVTTQVRARAYPTGAGYFPGPASSETYIQIDAGAAAFTSDLPVVIWHNFGGGIPPSAVTSPNAVGVFMLFDTNNPSGVTSLTNPPVIATRGGAHVRGSSTEGFAKRNLGIEFWTEVNREDRDLEVLGMPADSDWVLYAPNQFDRNYLHNPVAMELGRQMGHWAPRTRFAEFFFNTSGGVVTYPTTAGGNYNGVYVLMEKIKVNKDRLNIARLDAQDTNSVTITGGYSLKIDRANDTDDVNNFLPGTWPTGRFPWITSSHAGWNTQPIIFHDPDGVMIGSRPAQRNWFINYINEFEAALTGPSWTNPVTGYRAYIDEMQWIENHMLNIFTFNVDGYRLSGYFYKERDEPGQPRSGKLKQGPLWDFDRSQGTGAVDPRPFNPRQWKRPITGDQGTDLFGNNDNTTGTRLGVRWWWQMFHDPDFWQNWVDRWQDLRDGGIWSTTNVLAIIDRFANEVRQAQPRNAQRWPSGDSVGTPNTGTHSYDGYSHTFTGTYQGDVDFLKRWWTDRLDFVETNFLKRPLLSIQGGPVAPNTVVTISSADGKPGTVTYYTLDGTDPRLPGGAIAPGALSGTAPFTVTITQNRRLFARNYNPNHANLTNASLTAVGGNPPISTPWSGASIATYVVSTPPLRITEIMYNPAPPPAGNTNDSDNFEFVELSNTGGIAISLIGYRFTNGISFEFTAASAITNLGPGGRVLVVANRAAFVSRYPSLAGLVAGQYSGNLNNAGERIALVGPLMEPIHDFVYDDDWYPTTDGLGFSLVVVNESAPLNAWTNASHWRPSAFDGGSPGASDPAPVTVQPIIINEILAHPVTVGYDAIELFNPNATPVDVGDWYLSDDPNTPRKYRIPGGTTLPASGYLVFNQATSFGASFALSANGDEVYLASGDSAGRLTGYQQGFDFGPSALGVTFGRYTNSQGVVMEVAQSANTLGAANAYPMVGPVVISEIMYRPPQLSVAGVLTENKRDEFIEIRNISGNPVALYDPAAPQNVWRLQSGVEFAFPSNAVLLPGGVAVIVGFNPATAPATLELFKARYGITNDVLIYGPFSGDLDNSGERLELRRPGTVNPSTGLAPMVLVDRIDYGATNPWPGAVADGTGNSLQRVSFTGFGNDPTNWTAAGASAGRDRTPGSPPAISQAPQDYVVVEEGTAVFQVGVSGTGPFLYQWLWNGRPIDGAFGSTLVLTNVQLYQAGSYSVYALSDSGSALSPPAQLTVRPLPVFTLQPLGTNIVASNTFTLRVAAAGTGPVRYQWQFNGANIPSATNSTYSVTNCQLIHAGSYRVLATDDVGTRASQVAEVNVLIRPTIIQQPRDQVVRVGDPAVLTVVAAGQEPFWYRWRRNNSTLVWPGEASLVFSNAVLTNGGNYDVVITNLSSAILGGQALSARARLVVVDVPQDQAVSAGSDVKLTALLGGPVTFTNRFAWVFNGTNILRLGTNIAGGAFTVFTNELVLTNFTAEMAGTYSFFYSNAVPTTNPPPYTNFYLPPTAFSFNLTVGAADSDGDGMPNDWELSHGLNPNDPADAGADGDQDGLTNLQEYLAGTDPQDAGSTLRLVIAGQQPAAGVAFEFVAMSNRTYQVEYLNLLGGGFWSNLQQVGSAPTNRAVQVMDTPALEGQRYYRVRTPAP